MRKIAKNFVCFSESPNFEDVLLKYLLCIFLTVYGRMDFPTTCLYVAGVSNVKLPI